MGWTCSCGSFNGDARRPCGACGCQLLPPGAQYPQGNVNPNYSGNSSFVNDFRTMSGVGAAKLGFGAGFGAMAGIGAGRIIGKFVGFIAIIAALVAGLFGLGLIAGLLTFLRGTFHSSQSTPAVAANKTPSLREQRLADLRRQRAEAEEEARAFGGQTSGQNAARPQNSQIAARGERNPVAQNPPSPIGVYRAGGGVSAPVVVYKVDPGYSEQALRAKLSGSVLVSLVVGTDGRAQDIRIVRGLGLGLDEKAMDAVTQWRFRPGIKDGHPVPVQATIEVNFRLL